MAIKLIKLRITRNSMAIKMRPLVITCSLLHMVISSSAQQNLSVEQEVFSLNDMQELVLMNHPVVKQAGLLSKTAQARVLQSLGNFDPEVMASFGRKIFGGTEYYNHWDSELKIPLYLAGADLNVGYDRNVGVYNNPETRTNNTGLSAIGLSIPLGQGLLIDARRNTLRQAKIMLGYAEAEKVEQINALWLEAIKSYWNWYSAYQQNRFITEGVALAEKRFLALRQQVFLGDKPAIDSVEASITLLDRRVQQQETSVKLTNARLILSNYLWDSAGAPRELPAKAAPNEVDGNDKSLQFIRLDSLIAQAREFHPKLIMMRSQKSQLLVEEKYRLEMLKPKIDIKGSFLAGRRDFSYVPAYYDFRLANYKVGIDFTFPLFLRAERGKLREVRIKQSDLEYGLQQTTRDIETGVITALNILKAYQGQLNLQTKNVANQRILVNGEVGKFELGESNLFLINSRETKLIDMQIKRAELISSVEKSFADIYYRAGKRLAF